VSRKKSTATEIISSANERSTQNGN
jgi:hypothetical protein